MAPVEREIRRDIEYKQLWALEIFQHEIVGCLGPFATEATVPRYLDGMTFERNGELLRWLQPDASEPTTQRPSRLGIPRWGLERDLDSPRRPIRRFVFFVSRHACPCISRHAYTCAESGGSWRASEGGEEAHDGGIRGAKSGRPSARRQSGSESADSGVPQQVVSMREQVVSMRDAHSLTQLRRQHGRKTVTTASLYHQA